MLEALYRRLPAHHHARQNVLSDLINERSGLKGEKEVDFALRFINKRQYLIMHNLRLEDEFGAFQLDTLILSTRFILILEVKNWYGTLTFGENGQVIRTDDNGVEEGFPNPVAQAQLQQHRLSLWLQARGIPPIPIHYLVVISFPSTIIKSYSADHSIPKSIIHTNQILFKIQELEKLYRKEPLNKDQILTLSKFMIQAHTQPRLEILGKYNVNKDELIKGVFCNNCSYASMVRLNGKWHCEECKGTSVFAHLAAFNDYQLLISNYVSNREMRLFLKLDSAEITKKLLQKSNIMAIGKNRGRTYKLGWINLSKIKE